MGLLQSLGIRDAPYLPFLNTGTIYDVINGAFVPGIDDHLILNGGIAATNGVMGRPQVYKSTLAIGLIVNAMARYPHSSTYINDTETSLLNKMRLIEMVNLYRDDPEERQKLLTTLENDLSITNPAVDDLESFMEKVKAIDEHKQKNKKDYLVEIPILDPKTHQPQQMYIPTFVVVDSWSKGRVKAAMEILEANSASSSETNTVYMREGLAKTKIMGMIPILAVRSGIYFMLTAHVGDKFDMSGRYGPPPKEMQYMRQGDKVKSAGADYMTLISNLIEARSATTLLDSNKECEYPLPISHTAPTELSMITSVITRSKNNNGGCQFMPVMSQSRGLETSLTDYNYLRKSDYFGLEGNNVNHHTPFLPDVNLTRKTAATKLIDYKTARAVELLAQFCYIRQNWTVQRNSIDLKMTPEQLTDALVKRAGYAMDDILNSRGWWTYGKHPRSYLSLFDILEIASGTYKPKLISMTKTKSA